MHLVPSYLTRWLDFEKSRSSHGAKGQFIELDDQADDDAADYSADDLERLEAEDEARDLMRERDRRP